MEIGDAELSRARDPGTPDAELARLVGAVYAAQRARRPPERTEVESAVLAAIAGNPNTPPDLLFHLVFTFTSEVVHNPALVFLPLENPAIVATINAQALEPILRHPDAPPGWLALAAQRSENRIVLAVATSPGTPREVLVRLSNSPQAHLRIAVAGNPGAPPELLARFARTEDEAGPVRASLRAAVAANPGAPISTIELLAEDPRLLPLVAGNPALPAYLFDVLAAHEDAAVRAAIATQARLPVRLARRLAADPTVWVRRSLAGHAAEAEILHGLAMRDGQVRSATAHNPRAPESVLRRLTQAPEGKVRRAAEKTLALRAARTP